MKLQDQQTVDDKSVNNVEDIETIKEQSLEYLSGWKRAIADYENLKKESQREKGDWVKFANLNLVNELLTVYNNFRQAFDHVDFLEIKSADQEYQKKVLAWVKGMEQIKKQLQDFLNFQGVNEMSVKVGDKFNPEFHEAVADYGSNLNEEEPATQQPEQKPIMEQIVKVVSDGYTMHGKVILPARVVVGAVAGSK